MKAIILAAGQGTRLQPLTNNKPKCMVEFKGKAIINHILETFLVCGIDNITIITGYKNKVLESHLAEFRLNFIHNKEYKNTNMVHSLFCAEKEMDDDLIISYSDIIFSPKILNTLINSDKSITVPIDLLWRNLWQIRMENILNDAETLKLNSDGSISEIGQKPTGFDDIAGQYMGILKIKKRNIDIIKDTYAVLGNNPVNGRSKRKMFMTDLLQCLIDENITVDSKAVNGGWVEIDSCDDLENYNKHLNSLYGWQWNYLLDDVKSIAVSAGREILKYRSKDKIKNKSDGSPLTKADLVANQIITDGLNKLYPKYPILSEETVTSEMWDKRKNWITYWMIDPLDGTKEFLKGRDDFTVNIALIHNNYPVLGVVFAPAHELLYSASENWGSFKEDLKHKQRKALCVSEPLDTLTVLISSSHPAVELQNYLKKLPIHKCIPMGSSLKICKIADGEADIYPRLGPLSEWDIAAANVILNEASGYLLDYLGNLISYDSANGRIQSFVAAATKSSALFPNSIKKTIELRLKGQVL